MLRSLVGSEMCIRDRSGLDLLARQMKRLSLLGTISNGGALPISAWIKCVFKRFMAGAMQRGHPQEKAGRSLAQSPWMNDHNQQQQITSVVNHPLQMAQKGSPRKAQRGNTLCSLTGRLWTIQLEGVSVGLRRSEIDGHLSPSLKVAISVPRDVARLCVVQFLGIWIASSIKPQAGILVRSKSIQLEAVSVGLRRSEIDGHFEISHL